MPASRDAPPARPRTFAALVLAVVLLVTGCQARARVEIVAEADGSGRVAVLVGLDDAALERLGDPATALSVDDLARAGWRVDGPVVRDGVTWWRAAKAFATPDDLGPTVEELTGPGGVLADVTLRQVDGDGGTEHRVSARVDLADGIEVLGEPELTETLGGDPFGGYVQRLEAEEGRPVADMVSVRVAVAVGGEEETVDVRFGDDPVLLEAVHVEDDPAGPWASVAVGVAVGLVLAGAVVVLARRRRRGDAARQRGDAARQRGDAARQAVGSSPPGGGVAGDPKASANASVRRSAPTRLRWWRSR